MAGRKSTYNYNVRHRSRRFRWLLEGLALLFALLLILCAYAGKIDPGSFFPAPFLTLAYMPMLLLLALFLVLVLLFRLMTYNVLCFNYNEASADQGPSATMALILEADPDVVLLQEGGAAGIEWEEIPSLKPHMAKVRAKYPYTFTSPEGLNILSKYPFKTQALGEPDETRSVLGYNREMKAYLARAYDLSLPSGKQLRLIDFRLQSYHLQFGKSQNVRISPDIKPAPLERMRRSFALRGGDASVIRRAIDESPGNVIVCGDMNDVTTSNVYRIIRGDDMSDAWIEVGYGYAPTFNRYHLPFRIDHILYRGQLQALKAERLQEGSSDHYPLMATFDIDTTHDSVKSNNQ